MRISRNVADLPDAARGSAVAIGNFDGVHLGHQAVISEAAARGAPLAVITFEPHPRRFFRPDEPSFQLTPLDGKARCLRALGVDHLLVVGFDRETARIGHGRFVDVFIRGGFAARHVAVGYDFMFGAGRKGDAGYLRDRAAADGFGLSVVEPVRDAGGAACSSTSIRAFLAGGDPAGAASLLGRLWEVEGVVAEGNRRGRQIGFPTANLPIGEYIEPALGVYAVWAGVEEDGATVWRAGCANVGRRPTFGEEGVNVEAHVFDFAGDLYGRLLRVAFAAYIRPERKFDGVESLRQQIARDCAAARAALEGGAPPAG